MRRLGRLNQFSSLSPMRWTLELRRGNEERGSRAEPWGLSQAKLAPAILPGQVDMPI